MQKDYSKLGGWLLLYAIMYIIWTCTGVSSAYAIAMEYLPGTTYVFLLRLLYELLAVTQVIGVFFIFTRFPYFIKYYTCQLLGELILVFLVCLYADDFWLTAETFLTPMLIPSLWALYLNRSDRAAVYFNVPSKSKKSDYVASRCTDSKATTAPPEKAQATFPQKEHDTQEESTAKKEPAQNIANVLFSGTKKCSPEQRTLHTLQEVVSDILDRDERSLPSGWPSVKPAIMQHIRPYIENGEKEIAEWQGEFNYSEIAHRLIVTAAFKELCNSKYYVQGHLMPFDGPRIQTILYKNLDWLVEYNRMTPEEKDDILRNLHESTSWLG